VNAFSPLVVALFASSFSEEDEVAARAAHAVKVAVAKSTAEAAAAAQDWLEALKLYKEAVRLALGCHSDVLYRDREHR